MRCPLCQAVTIGPLYDMGTFTLTRCNACGLVFQDGHAPAQDGLIGEIYGDAWVKMKASKATMDLNNHMLFYAHVASSHCPSGGSLLEVGSGTGEFLYLMRQTGRMVRGVEPSAASSAYAKEHYSLDIIHSAWEESLLDPAEMYDAVVFWHVLEHVPDPVRFLAGVKTALRDGGRVVFCVPNNDCFTNLALGQLSPVYAERDHLFHYAANNLPLLLAQSGLRPVNLFTWEPPQRLEEEWRLYSAVFPQADASEIKQRLAFAAWLLAESRGYELFCVAVPI